MGFGIDQNGSFFTTGLLEVGIQKGKTRTSGMGVTERARRRWNDRNGLVEEREQKKKKWNCPL